VVLGVAAVVLAITGDVLISTHAGQAAISLTLAGVAMLVAVIVNRRVPIREDRG